MRKLVILFGVLCLAAPFVTPAQDVENESLSADLKVERLADGVWRHISYHEVEGFGRVPGNGLLVVSDGAAALIDTAWTDEQTRELFRWTEENLGAKIEIVIPTHSHEDCSGGLAAAHGLGARSYASKKTARIANRRDQAVPQITFRRTRDISVGSLRLRLHAPGPGHTVDNIAVWIPDKKVLFGGCMVRSARAKGLGNTREADLKRWPKSVATLLETYGNARWVVPGHGSPGGPELLRHTIELLENRE